MARTERRGRRDARASREHVGEPALRGPARGRSSQLLKQCVLDTLGVASPRAASRPKRDVARLRARHGRQAGRDDLGFGGKASGAVGGVRQRQPRPHGRLRRRRRGRPRQHRDDAGRVRPRRAARRRQRPRFPRRARRGHRHPHAPEPSHPHSRLDDDRRLVSDAAVRLPLGRGDRGEAARHRRRARSRTRSASRSRRWAAAGRWRSGAATHLRSMQAGFSGQARGARGRARARAASSARSEVLEGRYGLFKTYVRTEPDWDAISAGSGARFRCSTSTASRSGRRAATRARRTPRSRRCASSTRSTPPTSSRHDRRRHRRHAAAVRAARRQAPAQARHRRQVQHSVHQRGDDAQGQRHAGATTPTRRCAIPRCSRWPTSIGYRDEPGAELPVGGYSSLSRPAVEIELNDGRVLREQASGVPGDPGNPVGREVLEAKFRDCVSFGARTPGAIERRRGDRAVARPRERRRRGVDRRSDGMIPRAGAVPRS